MTEVSIPPPPKPVEPRREIKTEPFEMAEVRLYELPENKMHVLNEGFDGKKVAVPFMLRSGEQAGDEGERLAIGADPKDPHRLVMLDDVRNSDPDKALNVVVLRASKYGLLEDATVPDPDNKKYLQTGSELKIGDEIVTIADYDGKKHEVILYKGRPNYTYYPEGTLALPEDDLPPYEGPFDLPAVPTLPRRRITIYREPAGQTPKEPETITHIGSFPEPEAIKNPPDTTIPGKDGETNNGRVLGVIAKTGKTIVDTTREIDNAIVEGVDAAGGVRISREQLAKLKNAALVLTTALGRISIGDPVVPGINPQDITDALHASPPAFVAKAPEFAAMPQVVGPKDSFPASPGLLNSLKDTYAKEPQAEPTVQTSPVLQRGDNYQKEPRKTEFGKGKGIAVDIVQDTYKDGDTLNDIARRNLAGEFGGEKEVPDDLRRVYMLALSQLNYNPNPDWIIAGDKYLNFDPTYAKQLAKAYRRNPDEEIFKKYRKIETNAELKDAQQDAFAFIGDLPWFLRS